MSQDRLKKLLVFLVTLMSALILLGCSTSIVKSPQLTVPASLTTPCLPIQEMSDGKGSTVFRWAIDTSYQYADCSDKHKSTLLLIEEFNKGLK